MIIDYIPKTNTGKVQRNKLKNWINKGDKTFDEFIKLGDKKNKNVLVIFNEYTGGLKTSRDSWNYNFSLNKLKANIKKSVDFFKSKIER